MKPSPAIRRALRLARRIPNFPHPRRGRAVHRWAAALKKVIQNGKSR